MHDHHMGAKAEQAARPRWRPSNTFIVLGLLLGSGLIAAGSIGSQWLTNDDTSADVRPIVRTTSASEDPPLPANWVDPYFTRQSDSVERGSLSALDRRTYPVTGRPAGFLQSEDPPLPENWVDPYLHGED